MLISKAKFNKFKSRTIIVFILFSLLLFERKQFNKVSVLNDLSVFYYQNNIFNATHVLQHTQEILVLYFINGRQERR